MKRLLTAIVNLLAGWAGLFVYKYAKSDSTATVVLLFDNCTKTIVIRRRKWPFKGYWALPGGFLNIGTETLRQAAKRELREETTIDLPETEFVPVDERSEPNRDPRGHVIDHGFMVIISDARKDAVLAQLKANDDAEAAKVESVAELLQSDMAFDHKQLLSRVLNLAQSK